MKFAFRVFAGLVFSAAALVAHAQAPSGRDVVSPSAYLSREPVIRGASFQVAVVLKIRDGFHINAREKSADYLIATDLRVESPAGFKLGEVSYPKGELRTFSFSKTPLNVYQGQIVLRLPAQALANAPLGAQHIPLKVRYQACNNEICLPPVTLNVDAQVNVAAAGTTSRPAHSELFSAQ
jgi:hypothetical protein